LLDRKDKMTPDQFETQARQIFSDTGITDGYEKLTPLLDAKSMADLPESLRQSDAVREIQSLFTLLNSAKIMNAKFDITLMRGLDYYTGIVFEVFDTSPENNRSLFGGGRYDGLVGLFGVEPIGTVGMALGATTMEDFLRTHRLLPQLASTTHIGVISLGESLKGALKASDELRERGLNVDVDITGRKFDRQLRALDKKGIEWALIVGEREIESGQYTLKNLISGDERSMTLDAVAASLLQ
jgi:histidyl-tRNA synthetase